jgi:hypothetical protein
MQCLLGRFNNAVESGIESRIVLELRCVMARDGGPVCGSCHNGLRKVVIYVGVDPRQRELNPSDLDLAPARKKSLPAM